MIKLSLLSSLKFQIDISLKSFRVLQSAILFIRNTKESLTNKNITLCHMN